MRQETYRIKCPKHILFGDPLYFEKYASNQKRLNELVVDYKPSPGFQASIRRLTPRECLWLQGYYDSQIDKMMVDMKT